MASGDDKVPYTRLCSLILANRFIRSQIRSIVAPIVSIHEGAATVRMPGSNASIIPNKFTQFITQSPFQVSEPRLSLRHNHSYHVSG